MAQSATTGTVRGEHNSQGENGVGNLNLWEIAEQRSKLPPKKKRRRFTFENDGPEDLSLRTSDEETITEQQLTRQIKKMFCQHFNNLLTFELVVKKLHPDEDDDMSQRSMSIMHITANYCRSAKCRAKLAMKSYVRTQIELSRENDRNSTLLEEEHEYSRLAKRFARIFKPEDLFRVFPFLDDVLDWDRSTELCRWYLKQIFSNYAAEVKDWVDCDPDSGEAIKKDHYLDEFFSTMSIREVFLRSGIDEDDFKWKLDKTKEKKAKVAGEFLEKHAAKFVISEAPPPKRRRGEEETQSPE